MTTQPAMAEIRRAQHPAIVVFADPDPSDAESIAQGMALTDALVVGCIQAHAARSRRSDGELVAAVTSYPDPAVQNAALALFRARTGQAVDGGGCDARAALVLLDELAVTR